nr:hypothetical protein HK105_003751 [Polyrhizophydium stewartii]
MQTADGQIGSKIGVLTKDGSTVPLVSATFTDPQGKDHETPASTHFVKPFKRRNLPIIAKRFAPRAEKMQSHSSGSVAAGSSPAMTSAASSSQAAVGQVPLGPAAVPSVYPSSQTHSQINGHPHAAVFMTSRSGSIASSISATAAGTATLGASSSIKQLNASGSQVPASGTARAHPSSVLPQGSGVPVPSPSGSAVAAPATSKQSSVVGSKDPPLSQPLPAAEQDSVPSQANGSSSPTQQATQSKAAAPSLQTALSAGPRHAAQGTQPNRSDDADEPSTLPISLPASTQRLKGPQNSKQLMLQKQRNLKYGQFLARSLSDQASLGPGAAPSSTLARSGATMQVTQLAAPGSSESATAASGSVVSPGDRAARHASAADTMVDPEASGPSTGAPKPSGADSLESDLQGPNAGDRELRPHPEPQTRLDGNLDDASGLTADARDGRIQRQPIVGSVQTGIAGQPSHTSVPASAAQRAWSTPRQNSLTAGCYDGAGAAPQPAIATVVAGTKNTASASSGDSAAPVQNGFAAASGATSRDGSRPGKDDSDRGEMLVVEAPVPLATPSSKPVSYSYVLSNTSGTQLESNMLRRIREWTVWEVAMLRELTRMIEPVYAADKLYEAAAYGLDRDSDGDGAAPSDAEAGSGSDSRDAFSRDPLCLQDRDRHRDRDIRTSHSHHGVRVSFKLSDYDVSGRSGSVSMRAPAHSNVHRRSAHLQAHTHAQQEQQQAATGAAQTLGQGSRATADPGAGAGAQSASRRAAAKAGAGVTVVQAPGSSTSAVPLQPGAASASAVSALASSAYHPGIVRASQTQAAAAAASVPGASASASVGSVASAAGVFGIGAAPGAQPGIDPSTADVFGSFVQYGFQPTPQHYPYMRNLPPSIPNGTFNATFVNSKQYISSPAVHAQHAIPKATAASKQPKLPVRKSLSRMPTPAAVTPWGSDSGATPKRKTRPQQAGSQQGTSQSQQAPGQQAQQQQQQQQQSQQAGKQQAGKSKESDDEDSDYDADGLVPTEYLLDERIVLLSSNHAAETLPAPEPTAQPDIAPQHVPQPASDAQLDAHSTTAIEFSNKSWDARGYSTQMADGDGIADFWAQSLTLGMNPSESLLLLGGGGGGGGGGTIGTVTDVEGEPNPGESAQRAARALPKRAKAGAPPGPADVKLGGLGPDKDSDDYHAKVSMPLAVICVAGTGLTTPHTQVEKRNRQKEYSERVRSMALAQPRPVDRLAVVNETHSTPLNEVAPDSDPADQVQESELSCADALEQHDSGAPGPPTQQEQPQQQPHPLARSGSATKTRLPVIAARNQVAEQLAEAAARREKVRVATAMLFM